MMTNAMGNQNKKRDERGSFNTNNFKSIHSILILSFLTLKNI